MPLFTGKEWALIAAVIIAGSVALYLAAEYIIVELFTSDLAPAVKL